MANYFGDFAAGATVRIGCNTINTSGVPTALSGATVAIERDGADVTPSGGVTLNVSIDSMAGRNQLVITLATDPTTFAPGHDYKAYFSAGTAGGTTVVGIYIGEWSIANRNVTVGGYISGQSPATLILATPANKLVTDGTGGVTLAGYESGQAPPNLAAIEAGVASVILATPGQPIATDPDGNVSVVSSVGLTLGSGTVQDGANTGVITLTSSNMGTTSGLYTGRRLYIPLAAGGYLLTNPGTHAYAGGVHTFTFATANNAAPALNDVADVVGP